MATFEATAADFWRLAEEAKRRGLRVLHVPATNEAYVTSASDPTLLHRVTGFSCDCPGFLAWQRCTHHSHWPSWAGCPTSSPTRPWSR